MIIKKGRFGTDPYDILFKSGRQGTPSPTYALSSMIINMGRFGTDPYDIFLNQGTCLFFPRPLGEGQGEGEMKNTTI